MLKANLRRSQEFFAKVYAYLLERYTPFLADSRSTGHKKFWEKQLYMMDSTGRQDGFTRSEAEQLRGAFLDLTERLRKTAERLDF